MTADKIPTIIPAGALFTMSTGCYSDYYVHGVFRALFDVDVAALLAEWLERHPDQRAEYGFEDSAFFADAYRRGLFEAVESREWHLGDYSTSREVTLRVSGDWTPDA